MCDELMCNFVSELVPLSLFLGERCVARSLITMLVKKWSDEEATVTGLCKTADLGINTDKLSPVD